MAGKAAKKPGKRVSRRKKVEPLVSKPISVATHQKAVTRPDGERVLDLLCRQDNGANPVKRASTTYLNFLHESERHDVGSEVTLDLAFECARVERGDTRRLENMLVSQAHSLDGIFNRLVQRAAGCEDLELFEALMRMGLRAQGQSRAAIEAINEMKNPRSVAFVQQANIANNQQVLNGAHGQQTRFPPNELKGMAYEPALDTRSTATTSRSDQVLEAVGEVHRPEKHRRQGSSGS